MPKLLISGATGNIGKELIHCFFQEKTEIEVYAGVRDTGKAKNQFKDYPDLQYRIFDFNTPATWQEALQGMDYFFLLRPPQIANIKKVFRPLIDQCAKQGLKIVFLSVQGAEKSPFIPHHKIENLIDKSGLDYIYLRPGYFMQNLTTTLHKDISKKGKIVLPAADALFNWVDVKNVAESAVFLLVHFDQYKNNAYEITGTDQKSFSEVSALMSQEIGLNILYKSPGPLAYYCLKRKEGLAPAYIFVMIMLHFFARFSKTPSLSSFYQQIMGRPPLLLKEFLQREKACFKTDQ